MKKYNHKKIERKWQKFWEKQSLFRAEDGAKNQKYYVLIEFPYPSGDGLHVGHVRGHVAMDIIARKKRMEDYNVLYPIGWDAFGLPAENYAIKKGIHPSVAVKQNIERFKKQIKSFGTSFDWTREVNTTDPDYYKWTQWIFLQLFKKGLAYKKKMPINWCPSCKIGLANEEVIDGSCERCGEATEKKELEQWMLKITAYADRLIEDLETVDYLDKIKTQQVNWIGRSYGADINFRIKMTNDQGANDQLKVFTTRPDTLFGATFMVLSPEHKLVNKITTKEQEKAVLKYQEEARKKSDLERTELNKEKTGVFTGAYAINPANGKEMPIWIADYVLSTYGTGAIMAVPAHDKRDFEFALKYNLPVIQVVRKKQALIKSYLMGAEKITDQDLQKLGIKIVETTKKGDKKIIIPFERLVEYEKLIQEKMTPDFWNEYIGEEIVFLFKFKNGEMKRLVLNSETEEEIDCLAAEFMDEKWTKTSVYKWLAENSWYADLIIFNENGININSEFLNGLETEEACQKIIDWLEEQGLGKKQVQYHLRDWVFSRQHYWGEPIPMISCEKCGWVPVPEEELPLELPHVKKYEPTHTGESPLAAIEDWVNTRCPQCGGPAKRETDTMPNWAGSSWYFLRYLDPKNDKEFADQNKLKYWTPVDLYNGGMEHTTLHLLYSRFWHKFLYDQGFVPTPEPYQKRVSHGMINASDGQKMSKSRGNVINPDEIVQEFGADVLRLYEMFIGPYDQTVAWDTNGLKGINRFIEKVFNFENFKEKEDKEVTVLLHKTIKKVTEDIDQRHFNTAVASMMIFMNKVQEAGCTQETFKTFLVLINPFVPHLAEELWEDLGEKESIALQEWPAFDKKLIVDQEIEVPVQVNGKVRAKLLVSPDISEEELKKLALQDEKVKKHLAGQEPKKVIYVKGRLISIVI